MFSANFNRNRVKNQTKPWTCPLKLNCLTVILSLSLKKKIHTHNLNLIKKTKTKKTVKLKVLKPQTPNWVVLRNCVPIL